MRAAIPHSLAFMPQLHGLRALCILAVIYTHYLTEKYWLFDIYWGGLGVRCFFVLSGFLITSILIRESDEAASFKSMYVIFISRRAFRLYPILLVALIAGALLGIDAVRDGFLWHVTYLTNFYVVRNGAWGDPVGPLWSLAVEEQFYLFWPFVIYLVPRRLLPTLFLGLVAAAPIFRLAWRSAGFGDFGAWVLPPACFDSLAMGALLALYRERKEVIRLIGLAGICLWWALALSPSGKLSFLMEAGARDTAAAMVFAWTIARAASGFGGLAGKMLTSTALQYIGATSYGIYVLHAFVPYYFESLGVSHFLPHWLVKLISLGITIVLASISWHLLERPVMRWGQQLINRWNLLRQIDPVATPRGDA
ncbi:acyltransferase [Bradyrhizobium xenonodulans]|uniref:Acyltransferase n=1 Tax=Bradyrhizobium xenonodulans TaxID=2736875 RepID=A0ABY7MS20_9BRAD|nr:acyltransferase [Bradyrhizobium xenonodulans]WBL80334.1 acyltransferase [Bradyrhizobium xenonodulans]